jgi:hypothetical protein
VVWEGGGDYERSYGREEGGVRAPIPTPKAASGIDLTSFDYC